MASSDVSISIDFDSKKALAGIKSFSNSTKQSLNQITSTANLMKGALVGAAGVLVAGKLASGIKAVTEAASIQEDAVNALNTALKTSGEYSEQASKDMQDFASAIQANTKYGDELVLQQLSLAKAFGATNEQAKLITTAATELAAATGKSLNEATAQVSKTLGGFAGELGEVNPAIKALTSDQLKAGEAAKILIAQYGGSAAGQIGTFSGATTQLSNTYGDLLESLGDLIIKNPVVIKLVTSLTGVFQGLIKSVNKNQDGLKDIVKTLVVGAVKGFALAANATKVWLDMLGPLNQMLATTVRGVLLFAKAALELEIVQGMIDVMVLGFKGLAALILEAGRLFIQIGKFIPGIKGDVEAFEDVIERAQLKIIDDMQTQSLNFAAARESISGMEQATESYGDTASKVLKNTSKAISDVEKGASDLAESLSKTSSKSGLTAGAGGTLVLEPSSSLEKNIQALSDSITNWWKNLKGSDIAKGAIAGAGAILTDGKKAAGAAVSKLGQLGVQGAATLFGADPETAGAIGQAAGPLLEAMINNDKEALKAQIEGFVEALPTVIQALADGIPVVITTLAENVDEIIIALARGMPAVVKALANPSLWIDVAQALLAALGEVVNEGINEMKMEFAKIGPDFAAQLKSVFPAIAESLREEIQKIINRLTGRGGGGGSGWIAEGTQSLGSSVSGGVGGAAEAIGGGLSGSGFGLTGGDSGSTGMQQRIILELDGQVLADALVDLDRRNVRVRA